ncbi:MAG TPA: fumarate hydratase C-terminal domain-containing protein [Methanoregulaceae archaeon]|nr:MAG: fumarate hydratase C-terminal domain-containing protein [Methanolinea sp.]HON81410.1 fumarate hydratase C-terminal domain-containing protein [Methanoregulaceae archaeon]HPD10062.1 fumarate hydratase C-terminal domain-containing protein [Methanoregulaceae archaeon]HRT15068.1 fumarate hydratase C-terminal domain-containing protein [Methanoregulaceae archaeon]HRU30639.1 fumarate hydratase C-terminal domain-containing protein [Methanoregulaceae archaeon]
MIPVHLKTPLSSDVLNLRAGDQVVLSGTIYTARDEAHLRMMEDGIPFDPVGAAVYHCGPIISGSRVLAAGPTTSARLDRLTGFLLDAGVRALIGKGGMGGGVVDQLLGRGVYLALTGGCAVLAASRMTLRGVFHEDLGMAEAIWIIEADRLPLVVGIDSQGGDLFGKVEREAKLQFDSRYTT